MINALEFLSELTHVLSASKADKLSKSIMQVKEESNLEDALQTVLTDLDPEECWLMINIDWRDYEEFEWQAKAIAKTYGIKESFKWDGTAKTGDTAFIIFDNWLKQHGHHLMVWNKDDDSHNFFISKAEQTQHFLNVAKSCNLSCYQYRADYSGLKGFIVEEIFDKTINLSTQLATKTNYALSQNLKPYVYLMTTWCKPCRELSQHFKHPAMSKVFRGTYLIIIDFEIWISQIESVNLHSVKSVPTFAELNNEGKLTGRFGDASDEEFPDVESEAAYWTRYFNETAL